MSKRILTIQDISCIGKCSLTVALPIISTMGIETAIIPTAILSTHTAFNNFTFHDLSDDILKIVSHWEKERFNFDAVYTGYLGSINQIEIIKELISRLEHNYLIIDPVMADNGKFYTGFNKEFASKMKELCSISWIAIPNLTEACFLLDIPYIDKGYDNAYIKDVLKKLYMIGIKNPVITGISFSDDKIGAMAYISENDSYFYYCNKKLDFSMHGTGDIFSSVFSAQYVLTNSIQEAIILAVDFVSECMKNSIGSGKKYGAEFEKSLPYLINKRN